MRKITRRILSIIALVLMVVFVILLTISMYNGSLLDGALLYIAIAAGVGGIAIYLMIMRDNRLKGDSEIIAAIKEGKIDVDELVPDKPSDTKNTTKTQTTTKPETTNDGNTTSGNTVEK